MSTQIKTLAMILCPGEVLPDPQWELRVVQSEQCLSYIAWNKETREALVVDPKQGDLEAYRAIQNDLRGYLWLGVFDTHTHADHVSCAARIGAELSAPVIMHAASPSQRVSLRVCGETVLPSRAAQIRVIPTPGHTQDAVCLAWGPFLFTGDTLLYNDTGRDDLPGGCPEAHFESLVRLKAVATQEMIVLPGHDSKGGRASSWRTQLIQNESLKQKQEDFVKEASAFDAPAPALLKEALRENFK